MRSVAIGPDSNETRMSSSVSFGTGIPARKRCARFTSVSTPPNSRTTSSTAALHAAGSVTSQAIARAAASAPPGRRSSATTVAPALAMARHTPRPMFPPPPVMIETWPSITDSAHEPPELPRVGADDLAPLVGGHVGEQRVDRPARVGPVVAVVREVGRPGHVLDPDLIAHGDAVPVDDEGREPVIAEVLARHLLDLDAGVVAVAPVAVVGHLEEVRDPAAADLDPRHPQLREAVVHTLEDQLGHERHRVGEGAGA